MKHDEEERCYPVTDGDIKHAKKFPKIVAWALAIGMCLYIWGWFLIRMFVR